MRSASTLAALAVLLLAGCGGGRAQPARTPSPTATATARPAHRPFVERLGPHPLRGAAARRAAVPILMYHVVTAPPPGTPYPQLWVPGPLFAAHMRALSQAGYRAVTLSRVLDAWRSGAALPRKPIVVSFDDGYPSQYRNAYPVLRRLGWPGVLNLELGDLGPGGIRAREVRRMVAAGWEVDSHTLTHPDLTTLGDAALHHELGGSRAALRRRFGPHAGRSFCYPAGRFDARVEAAVRAAGYRAATTELPGRATAAADPYALPRVRVNGTDSAQTVLAAVRAS